MKVFLLKNTYYDDTRIEGIVSNEEIAKTFAEGRGNSYEEIEVDACLVRDLNYLIEQTQKRLVRETD